MRHHTKDKGDLGLGFVIADLLSHNIQIAFPLSEHQPFDLIAISEGGLLKRVQVKYRAAVNYVIHCDLRSGWSDRNGHHRREFDGLAVDAVAVFCPNPQICCYVRTDEFTTGELNLRLAPTRNNQLSSIRMASYHRNPNRIFE
jgi:hypothetical protein